MAVPIPSRRISVTLFVLLAFARATAAQPQTFVRFESESGDYIGAGQHQTFTAVTASARSGGVSVNAGGYFYEFQAPAGAALVPGTYEGATRYPFNIAPAPGLSVFGNGRGCNTLTGRFIVHEIATSGTQVIRLAVDFEQHCEGFIPALFGWVRFNSEVPVSDSDGDGVRDLQDNCVDVANADQTDTDADGAGNVCDSVQGATFVYLDSQSGDYIGGGGQFLFTPEQGGPITAHGTPGGFVSFGAGGFSYQFETISGQPFRVGAYEGATRYPFNALSEPGLNVSGNGRGCNRLTGRFDVLEVAFGANGQVEHFAIDFEQHCEGGTAALFGVIRFNSEIAGAGEFDTDEDGVINPADNCPEDANPNQANRDGDDLGDACDPYPDAANNLLACVEDVDARELDINQLGQQIGALELELAILRAGAADADADWVPDSADHCPATPARAAVNREGCSRQQFCEAIPVASRNSALCGAASFGDEAGSCWIRRIEGTRTLGCFARDPSLE